MTALSVAQSAALRVGVEPPLSLVSAAGRTEQELTAIIREAALDLLDKAEWRVLDRRATITGDGTATAFALPSDYHAFRGDAHLWTDRLDRAMAHILSVDDWQELITIGIDFTIPAWTLIGDEINIRPAPADGEIITYYYRSNLIWRTAGGADVATLSADDDAFRLDERLLTLETIWRWKALKGVDYAEDMANAERALARAVGRDRGPKEVTAGRPRRPDARLAYPWTIVP